jgi:hypothetical protein
LFISDGHGKPAAGVTRTADIPGLGGVLGRVDIELEPFPHPMLTNTTGNASETAIQLRKDI